MAEKKARKLSGKEMAWYVIAAVLAVVGLTFVVFAIVGDFLPVLAEDNWVTTSEAAWLTNWSPMGYRYWGLTLIGIAGVLSAIVLNFFAREGDKDEERALRRAQRLGLDEENVVEVPVESEAR